jgi:hypothetical protein
MGTVLLKRQTVPITSIFTIFLLLDYYLTMFFFFATENPKKPSSLPSVQYLPWE